MSNLPIRFESKWAPSGILLVEANMSYVRYEGEWVHLPVVIEWHHSTCEWVIHSETTSLAVFVGDCVLGDEGIGCVQLSEDTMLKNNTLVKTMRPLILLKAVYE